MSERAQTKWFHIIHSPIGSNWTAHTALKEEQESHARTRELLGDALAEADAARGVLATVIQHAGGRVSVSDGELVNLDVDARIHSQHDGVRNESVFWVEATR